MSSIAEFYSRNLANEVIKGMSQKAKTGGTTGKAPIGYSNRAIVNEEGREVRTVVLDETRAPLIRWAFTAYASGEFTITQLVAELTARGLTTPPTPKRAAHALKPPQLYNILTNPYYLGIVKFRGVSYPGRHTPLVDESTWQKCQRMFESRSTGEKARTHNHYLKSSVFCGQCESRMIIHYSTNRAGVTYPYFVCVGRHQKRTACTMSAVNIHEAEHHIENLYKLVALTPEMSARTKSHLRMTMEAGAEAAKRTQKELLGQQTRLMERSKKLLDGHLDGTIPSDLYRPEQERINREMTAIGDRLNVLRTEFEALEQNLDDAMALTANCYDAYVRAPDALRRTFNQAFFTRILITRDESVEGELAEPFATIITTAETNSGASPEGETPPAKGFYKVTCSKETDLVAPSEALASNSRPLLALRDALHRGVIARTVQLPARSIAPGTRRMKQVTPPVRDQLVADYRAGLGIYELARKHGLHRYTISQHLTAAGVVMRRTITNDERERARELYLAGETYAAIARQLKRDPATVKKMIQTHDHGPYFRA